MSTQSLRKYIGIIDTAASDKQSTVTENLASGHTPREIKAIAAQALKTLGYRNDPYTTIKRQSNGKYAIKIVLRRGEANKSYDPQHQARFQQELENQGLAVSKVRKSYFEWGYWANTTDSATFYLA